MRTRDILPIADDFYGGDIKGWALGWFFPIAEVLYVAGESIPESWEFTPSPLLVGISLNDYLANWADGTWQTNEAADEYRANGAAGLVYVGNVLVRYMELFVYGTDRDY